ncbi:hypothetical protein ACJX0J_010990, partial [Zea mays]
ISVSVRFRNSSTNILEKYNVSCEYFDFKRYHLEYLSGPRRIYIIHIEDANEENLNDFGGCGFPVFNHL